MKEGKSHIGTILKDNYGIADRNIRAYERIIVKLNSVANIYEELGIGKFSKEVLADILNNRTKNIQEQFLNLVEDEVKSSGMKIPVMIEHNKKTALDMIRPLAETVKSFIDLYEYEKSKDGVEIDLLEVVYDNGRLQIDKRLKEIVKNRFEIKIRTKQQSELFEDFIEVKKVFDSFVKKAKTVWNGVKIIDQWDLDAMIYVEDDEISLNPYVIESMREKE